MKRKKFFLEVIKYANRLPEKEDWFEKWKNSPVTEENRAKYKSQIFYTCHHCGSGDECECAFDDYNTNGDCLAIK